MMAQVALLTACRLPVALTESGVRAADPSAPPPSHPQPVQRAEAAPAPRAPTRPPSSLILMLQALVKHVIPPRIALGFGPAIRGEERR